MAVHLEQIREKLNNARNLQGVVETMRGLAAVNIRRAENAAEHAAAYTRSVHMALHVVLDTIAREGSSVYTSHVSGPLGAVVITSDQGLCGQFNDRITSYALELLEQQSAEGGVKLLVVGSRGVERLEEAGMSIHARFDAPSSVEAIPRTVSQTLIYIEELLSARKIGKLLVIANRLHQSASFAEHHQPLIPFDPARWTDLPTDESPFHTLPDHPVPAQTLLTDLIQEQMYIDLFQAFSQSFAAENAARLASMQNALENIEERLSELQAEYRRVRQDVITQELMDLMGGVQAVS